MTDLTAARVRELGAKAMTGDTYAMSDFANLCLPNFDRIAKALALLERVEAQDAGLVEAMAKTIHDTDDMADTVWPDSDDDSGYRGESAYVRLCQDPELFRNAARATLAALVGEG
jgi:hypothetical protein